MTTIESRAVPSGATGNEALARLADAVKDALSNPAQAAQFKRYENLAGLLYVVETTPKGTKEYGRATAALYRAVDATRNYARRNNLKPNTCREVLAEGRRVLEALR